MPSFETNPLSMVGACYPAPPSSSESSATSTTQSPASSNRCDDTSDDDVFSNFQPVPCNSNLGFLVDSGDTRSRTSSTSTGGVAASTPLYNFRLREIFTKYEQFVQGSGDDKKQRVIADTCNTIPSTTRPEARPLTVSSVGPHLPSAARLLPKRGNTKRKAGRAKKNGSGTVSRPDLKTKKRALARRCQKYEFMRLGDARQTEDGSIEVEVHRAPMYVTCDQLRGENALVEAKDLGIRKFGIPLWER
ncbi:hypothetical protein AAL_05508 [Moelleriella libera RCEF 2490]|uniref:Uncharacterized protein n=1 Tax=Moelleriella libera RCEF 2490 TaxID=1081109 RepID=A0A168ADF9_9HYPO|nr:hypothetical protein AAL_05508 [Moelleriella libera RCEF 2490]